MRLSKASILAQALLLAAVAAQSLDASSLVNEITTTAAAAATTTAASPSPAETTQSPVTTSAAPSTTSTTSEAAPTTTSTQSTSSSTTTSVAEVPSTTNTPAPSTTADAAETSARSTTSQPSDETTTSVTPSVSSTIVIKTITAQITEDGTTKPTVMLSTSTSAVTSYPSLNGDKGSSNSGLSSSDKKIIIGVVVGVGGAILLGVLGVVFWRIQKKRSDAFNDEDDDLMGGTAVGSGPREKAPGPTQSGTPFKNTLDQYHNPGPVNAASNF